MKHSILILIGCALAISPLGAEDNTKPEKKAKPEQKGPRDGAPGKGAPGKGGPRDGSFFKDLDKDGDKAISKEEAGERWERMGQLDKDNDGKLTMQELAAGRGGPDGPGKGGPGKGAPGEMFKRADKNGDGKISKDEVPEEAWARMSRLDKNGDDAISGDEIKAGAPGGPGGPGGGPGKGGEFLKRADKNGDGNISKDEVPEQAWERLGKLDKNQDGSVSKEEMAAGMAAMRGGDKGKGGPPQQGGPGAMFERFDKDKNDKLSESEVPAEMWSKLRKADTDADGLVSKKELGKVYGERGGADTPPKKRPEPKKDEA